MKAAKVESVANAGWHLKDTLLEQNLPTIAVLAQITQYAGDRNRAQLGCQFPGEQPQQSGLSGSVGADETCCAAGKDGRQGVEHGVSVGPGERQVRDRKGG